MSAPRPSGAAMRFDDVAPATIVLVRHGETALTTSKALSGSSVPGPPLSAAGRVQAAKVADLVHRIGRELWPDLPYPGRLIASPMVRTQETAAIVGRRIGQHVTLEPGFAEADFGQWEGLVHDGVEARWPGQMQRFYTEPDFRAPGGESLLDIGARVEAALTGVAAVGSGSTTVVVSHVMAIRAALGVTMGLPPTAWTWQRILPTSVSVVRWWPDGMRELVVAGLPPLR